MKPLHDTRILDLTRLLPGAVCTMLLRDLGGEIIKIEDPNGGDYARSMPPLLDGLGIFFRSSNRGKKSIAINLKAPAGQAALHRLVETADVLIEGFRPGVTTRLGADYETLKAINPRLVYCSLSGWGQSGPYAQVSGHDLNYIARNGLLGADMTPRTPGAQVADVGGAYVAVMGVLAALLKRERSGQGDYVDVALSEAAMPLALAAWVEAQSPNSDDALISLRGESACYRVYWTADDQPVTLAAIEPKFWMNFCRAVAMPEWITQQTSRDRQPDLIEAVAALFKTKSADEWAALLDDADCCFSRVNSPAQLLDDPHIQARGMVGVTEAGVPWMRSPIRLGAADHQLGVAPEHGEHTSQILAEAGFTDVQISQLLNEGIIRQAP
ncbi:MAG: CaiB/BaiF CoA-transferase family protein [Chloroflexi bacterium]|nr:CaiB/BaiF CoA-transferase family protein [Chloroflexota bacterium]